MDRLLIMGGGRDANLPWVAEAAEAMGIATQRVLINPQREPRFEWDLEAGAPVIDGEPFDCRAAFMRYDVFSALYTNAEFAAENATNWYTVFSSLCELGGVRILNGAIKMLSGSKLVMLALARQHGFAIPRTIIGNSRQQLDALGDPSGFIAKPVAGGTYCVELQDALAEADWMDGLGASPAIVQEKLRYPEFRLYRIGRRYFAFNIDSRSLDSRLDRQGGIVPIDISTFPAELIDQLTSLTDAIGCDFCAVDLKTDRDTEKLVFLELNNGPMFMGYDKTINGAMARQIVTHLMRPDD